MKRMITQCLVVMLALTIGQPTAIQAQEDQSNQMVVVQKKVHEDGSTTMVKKRFQNQEEMQAYLESLDTDDLEQIKVEIFNKSGKNTCSDKMKEDFMRGINREFESEMKDLDKERYRLQKDMEKMPYQGEKKALLGVYPDGSTEQGVRISDIVSGSGAEAAGMEGGDIIAAINGKVLKTNGDLTRVLGELKPGDQVQVRYIRDGQEYQTTSTLTEKRGYSYSRHRDPCKVFIGVNVGGHGSNGKGVRISSIIDDTPAAATDMQGGDIIILLDDVETNTYNELLRERNKHESGDWFTLTILRNGQRMDVDAQFKSCDKEEDVPETKEEAPKQEEPQEVPQPELPIVEFNDNSLQPEELSAFPNPTFGKLNIEFRANAVPTTVRILDSTGKLLYMEDLSQFDGYYSRQMNVGEGTPGVLFVNIIQGDKVKTEKVVLLPRA